MVSHSLNDLQAWMQMAITRPEGVAVGTGGTDAANVDGPVDDVVERVILPSNEMSSRDRLRVYQNAYFARLVDCLRSQFPAARHAAGDDAFDGLAYGYICQHPSTSYSLASLGNSFEQFLLSTRPARLDSAPHELDFADFLIDLARLEQIYGEVFQGRGPESVDSLNAADLLNLSVEEFAVCRLVPHECVRLVEFQFPVHDYATAVRNGNQPSPPGNRPVKLVIARRDYVVRRFEVSIPQWELLNALVRQQATIGESLQIVHDCPEANLSTLGADVRTWFRNWSAVPLFAGVLRSGK